MFRNYSKLSFLLIVMLLGQGCKTQSAEVSGAASNLQLSPLPKVEAEGASQQVGRETTDSQSDFIPRQYEDLLNQIVPGTANEREHTDWYGLYMQGEKVGYLAQFIKLTGTKVKIGSTMYAKINGMGRTTEMTINDERLYSRQTGQMESLTFSQTSPDQMGMLQKGRCLGGQLKMQVSTGNRTQEIKASCQATLADALAVNEFILNNPAVGKSHTLSTYEPSMMQMVKVATKITKIEPTLVDGVAGQAIYVQEETIEPPGTGVNSVSIYDQTGRMLSTEASGVFIAKLESEEVAKKPGSGRDILVANVVKVPSSVEVKRFFGAYQLGISGLPPDIQLPENGSGQKVVRKGEIVEFALKPQAAPLATKPLSQLNVPDSARPYLQDEPQYQSTAPEIQELAKKLTAASPTLWAAHQEILSYVYKYLKKSYVPALANAVDVLKIGKGDCTEHSTLYVALARAAGIPARQAVGVAYWPQGGGFGWHAWAEIWTGEEWITVDPTWGQEVADPSHLLLARGAMGEQVRIAGMLGNMKIEYVK